MNNDSKKNNAQAKPSGFKRAWAFIKEYWGQFRRPAMHSTLLASGEKTCIDCHKGIAHHLPDMAGVPMVTSIEFQEPWQEFIAEEIAKTN